MAVQLCARHRNRGFIKTLNFGKTCGRLLKTKLQVHLYDTGHRLRPLAFIHCAMPKKSAKSTRKFAASGQLKKQIQDRRKHQQIKRKAASRQTQKNTKRGDRKDGAEVEAEEETEEEAAEGKKRCLLSGYTPQ